MFILNAVCVWTCVRLGLVPVATLASKPRASLGWTAIVYAGAGNKMELPGQPLPCPGERCAPLEAGIQAPATARPCHPEARLSAKRAGNRDMREGRMSLQALPRSVYTHCPASAPRTHRTNLPCIGAFRGMMPPEEWEKAVHQIKIRMQCRNKVHCTAAPPDFAMALTLINDIG